MVAIMFCLVQFVQMDALQQPVLIKINTVEALLMDAGTLLIVGLAPLLKAAEEEVPLMNAVALQQHVQLKVKTVEPLLMDAVQLLIVDLVPHLQFAQLMCAFVFH